MGIPPDGQLRLLSALADHETTFGEPLTFLAFDRSLKAGKALGLQLVNAQQTLQMSGIAVDEAVLPNHDTDADAKQGSPSRQPENESPRQTHPMVARRLFNQRPRNESRQNGCENKQNFAPIVRLFQHPMMAEHHDRPMPEVKRIRHQPDQHDGALHQQTGDQCGIALPPACPDNEGRSHTGPKGR